MAWDDQDYLTISVQVFPFQSGTASLCQIKWTSGVGTNSYSLSLSLSLSLDWLSSSLNHILVKSDHTISPRVDWKGAKELGGHTSQMETAASERTLYTQFRGPNQYIKSKYDKCKKPWTNHKFANRKSEVSWRESMPCLPCMQLVDMAAPFIHGAYQWGHQRVGRTSSEQMMMKLQITSIRRDPLRWRLQLCLEAEYSQI